MTARSIDDEAQEEQMVDLREVEVWEVGRRWWDTAIINNVTGRGAAAAWGKA